MDFRFKCFHFFVCKIYDIFFWSCHSELPPFSSIINYELLANNIELLCFTGNSSGTQFNLPSPFIPVSDALEHNYDYIIIASETYEKEILNTLLNTYSISSDKIILGSVFKLSFFNLSEYIQLKQKKISIIAESCYGGYIYHNLKLQFLSPFINIRISDYDYVNLLHNICNFKNISIVDSFSAPSSQNFMYTYSNYPQLVLNDTKTILNCVHSENANTALSEWNKRVSRCNYKHLLYCMIIESDSMLEKFNEITGITKLGFYYEPTPYRDILYLPEYKNVSYKYMYSFRSYVHDNIHYDTGVINLIKTLNNYFN